ncbi:MAG: plastocyanin [Planctomycetota bacterium]|jgi:plastocyanin
MLFPSPLRSASLLLASVLMVGGLDQAQTTHFVALNAASFSPASLTIDVGDTVQWDWVGGFHNVESGVGGVPDGIFTSGAPTTAATTFSVTFDQAFLDANPTSGKRYAYYCIVHVGLGMSGDIVVNIPASGTSRNAGANPASLVLVNPPQIGGNFVASQDLTTTGHSLAAIVAYASPLNFPLGGGQVILVNVLDPNGELFGQALQSGPVATWNLAVPSDPALCGFRISAQGIHIGGVQPFALSNALDLVVGN